MRIRTCRTFFSFFVAALLLLPFWVDGQSENPTSEPSTAKGAAPVATHHSSLITHHSTRAVVVGISDYQDPAIPDLRFADRDAEAFYRWLHDPEACALPDSNIQLLTNKKATTAQMMMAMDWLIEVSKSGDQAFLYFSGHGDVERITEFQRGYLLSYNSPPAVYGAGAFPLSFLQDIITTLSNKGVQVFVITDACRAGKLAGSSVNGTQATAAQLSQQFAKEIKILSCQPDEFSLEGEQWGGGRGCFSYHLEDALYGFADDNHDAVVDLRELRRYLEDHVSKESAPQNQMPMVSGPAQTNLASIQEAVLTARKSAKGKGILPFLAIENKGLESRLLEKTDSSIRALYAQFLTAIDSGQLMSPLGKSANDYYNLLIETPEIAALQGTMKRKFAAALMDEGQTYINQILKSDQQALDNLWTGKVKRGHLPRYFQRASEILGEDHYIYRDLKAKEFYFRATTIRKTDYPDSSFVWFNKEKRQLFEKSLEWDSTSALTLYDLGLYYLAQSKTPPYSPETKACFEKAALIAPGWAIIHWVLASQYVGTTVAINHLKRAIELDSTFLTPYNVLPMHYDLLGQKDSAFFWRQLFIYKFSQKLKTDSASVKAYECLNAGITLIKLKNYESAKASLVLGEKISGGNMQSIYSTLVNAYTELLEFENAIQVCKKQSVSKYQWCGFEGDIYFYFLNDTTNAINAWAKTGDRVEFSQIQAWLTMGYLSNAFSLAKKYAKPGMEYGLLTFYIAESSRQMGMEDTARYYLNQIIEKVPVEYKPYDDWLPGYVFAAIALKRLGKKVEFQQLMDTASSRLAGDPWLYFHLACVHAQTGKEKTAIESLDKAIELGWQPNSLFWLNGTLCDPLLNPIRETEAFKALVRQHFPKYYDIATRVPGKR